MLSYSTVSLLEKWTEVPYEVLAFNLSSNGCFYFKFCLCEYMLSMSMCVHMMVGIHVQVCTCVDEVRGPYKLSSLISILFLETGSLAEHEFCGWPNELTSKPQGSSNLYLPSPGFQGHATTPSLLVWVLATPLFPYAGTASTRFTNYTVSLAPHLGFEVMGTKIPVFMLTKTTKKKAFVCITEKQRQGKVVWDDKKL